MAKSYAETPSFRSVTGTQTENKAKTSTFLAAPAMGEVQAPPSLVW